MGLAEPGLGVWRGVRGGGGGACVCGEYFKPGLL